MKPRAFRYHRPTCRAEALQMLAAEDEDARVLAGGQSLVPLMNLRFAAPSALVDINRCDDLAGIRETDGWLTIGAAVRQRDAELSPLVRRRCPLVAEALRLNGHPATRHRGTVGGTLAHADPGAELPGVAVALGAEMVVDGPAGERVVPAADFFLGALTTCLAPGEMLVAVRFPAVPSGAGWALVETGVRAHDLAIAGVAVQTTAGTHGRTTRIAAFGIAAAPLRLPALERLVTDLPRDARPAGDAVREAVDADIAGADLLENLQASAAYRRTVTAALAARALDRALAGARAGL